MIEVKKVWGKEVWIANNNKYCGKLLCLDTNAVCSFHYHTKKTETFYCLNGEAVLRVGDTAYIMRSGSEPITIQPRERHQYWGIQNSILLEVSTPHNEKDVTRILNSVRLDDNK